MESSDMNIESMDSLSLNPVGLERPCANNDNKMPLEPEQNKLTVLKNQLVYPSRDIWNLSCHLNSNPSYRVCDFIHRLSIANLKEFWEFHNNLDKVNMLRDNNYYLMRAGITPTKEDVKNRNGTIISILVPNDIMNEVWICLAGSVIGETFTKKKGLINGLGIKYVKENKKGRRSICSGSFVLMKIWVKTLEKEINDSVRIFLKETIPKYVSNKYANYNYSIQVSNIKPEY
jgi:hypothetical protein